MKDVFFGSATGLDTGVQTSVTINNRGDVLEVHKSQALQDMWYRTGSVSQMNVGWNGGQKYDSGVDPSVAMNDSGKVVEVHRSQNNFDFYYHVGNFQQSKVNFGPSVKYDSGVNPDVAMDNSNWCVEVHKSEANDKLWYQVGNINGDRIDWGNSVNYDSGVNSKIAMNNNNVVVEVHKSQVSFELWYHVGVVNKNTKRIDWGPSIKYDAGALPSIAITDDNFAIEVHQGGGPGDLWRRVGTIDVNSKTISWSGPSRYDSGQSPSVACARNGSLAIQTHQSEVESSLFYSTSLILDRWRWMEAKYDSLKSKQLWQLTLPASHDSGAYNMSTKRAGCLYGAPEELPGAVTRPFAAAHNTSINQQLDAGIRVFDLRPCLNTDGNFYAYHDVLGASFSSMFDELANFLSNTSRELVILEISHFCFKTLFDPANYGPDADQHAKLVKLIQDKIGPYLYVNRSGDNLAITTLETFVRDGSRAIVWYKDSYIEKDTPAGFYKESDLLISGSYSNSDVVETVRSDQAAKMEKYRNNPFFLTSLSWTLTFQGAGTLVKGGIKGSLYDMSRQINPFLGQFMSSANISASKINFLYVDFENDARVTDCAVQHVNSGSPYTRKPSSDPNQINYTQDGMIVADYCGENIFVIDQATVRYIPDLDTNRRVFNQVRPLKVDISQYIMGRPISTASRLVRNNQTGAIYFEDVDGNGKTIQRWISSPAALNYTFNTSNIQDADISNPGGPDFLYHELDGLMTADSSGINLHDQGVARHIPDWNTYLRIFREFRNGPSTREEYYHIGRPLSTSSRLITSSDPGNQIVYFQDVDKDGNSIKRNITSAEAFDYCYFDWTKIQRIDPAEINSMKDGPAIFLPQSNFRGTVGSVTLRAVGPFSVCLRLLNNTQNGRELQSSGMITEGHVARINPEDRECKHNDIIQVKMLAEGYNGVGANTSVASERFIFQSNSAKVANYHSDGNIGSVRPVFDNISG